MKAGVLTSPCGVTNVPERAAPSTAFELQVMAGIV
jgi:hypothetical protein